MESDKNFCTVPTLFKTRQMFRCNSNKVDGTMLSNRFLANQLAGTPVHISCHMIMCLYELIVQFCGTSTGTVKWPVDRTLVCWVCPPRLKAHHRQNWGSTLLLYFGVGSLSSKSSPCPLKKIGKSILKWFLFCSSFLADSSRAWWLFS